jgi:hypothetical protein
VSSQYSGGFQWVVTLTAGSSAITAWTVTWTYANGQTVSDAYNANVTQSGSSVTASNESFNGSLSAGAKTSFGGAGSWNNTTNTSPTPSCVA